MDNPFAFPRADERDAMGCGITEGSNGMTLRDWFAGQALPAVIAATSAGQHNPSKGASTVEGFCLDAYEIADAMLAARINGGQSNG